MTNAFIQTLDEHVNIISDIKYNDMISANGFTKVDDWLNQSNEKIHKYLLYNAIWNLINDKKGDLNIDINQLENIDIIERRKKSYLESPICTFKNKKYPFTEIKIDMKKYWNNEYLKDINDYSVTNYNNYENKDDAIVSVNYVNGTAKLRSRLDNVDRVVSFDKINKDSQISLDDMSIRDTFTYKSMNSNY